MSRSIFAPGTFCEDFPFDGRLADLLGWAVATNRLTDEEADFVEWAVQTPARLQDACMSPHAAERVLTELPGLAARGLISWEECDDGCAEARLELARWYRAHPGEAVEELVRRVLRPPRIRPRSAAGRRRPAAAAGRAGRATL